MKEVTVAARYARALFIVTEKRGETSHALEDLKSLVPMLAPGNRVGNFLISPQVRLADKRAVLTRGLEGKVARVAVLFVDLLMRKRRLHEFPIIVEQFEALVERAQGIKRAQVVSAVPLVPAETERLIQELERYTRARIKLTSEVDPALLGGALVRIGDRVIDRSAKSLLAAIEEQLHEVSV